MTTPQAPATTFIIHPKTRIGHVHYTVANLDRQIAFYRDILGFKVHWQDGQSAGLGAGAEDLLRLTEVTGAKMVRGTTGLYHTAFLVPNRMDLAHLLKRIVETNTQIQGFSDHNTHLAIYLPDTEENGIELAWDFPKEQWPRTFAEMIQRNRGFDPYELLNELAKNPTQWDGLAPKTQVGHVHLHVGDIEAGKRFYREQLGFEYPFNQLPPPQYARQMRFFSAGGYHHHIGTNIWNGENAPHPPADATGLRYYTAVLPHTEALDAVTGHIQKHGIITQTVPEGIFLQDPSGNGIVLTTAS